MNLISTSLSLELRSGDLLIEVFRLDLCSEKFLNSN